MAERPLFDAPIPGQSLTAELGARPWQHPPKYVTVDEATEYYAQRVFSPDVRDDMLNVMEMGIPLTTIAEALQGAGTMQGLHTIDIGILMLPILVEMLAYIGDEEGVDYNLGIDRPQKDEDKFSDSTIALVKNRMKKRMESGEFDKQETADEPMPEETMEEAPATGLMARRM